MPVVFVSDAAKSPKMPSERDDDQLSGDDEVREPPGAGSRPENGPEVGQLDLPLHFLKPLSTFVIMPFWES